jgi:hypothetical protein
MRSTATPARVSLGCRRGTRLLASVADLQRLLSLPPNASRQAIRAALAGTSPERREETHAQFMRRTFPSVAARRGYVSRGAAVTARAASDPEPSMGDVVRRTPSQTIGY